MREHFEKVMGVEAKDSVTDLVSYSYDASGLKGEPRLVVFPRSLVQLHATINYCKRTNTGVVMRGAGTNQNGMCIPNNSVVVCTSKMNKIKKINFERKIVEVEAGAEIKKLNKQLVKKGYFFPITTDLPSTAGGMFSRDEACRFSNKYGTFSDNVLELSVVDGTGKNFVVKEPKDFAGTEGTVVAVASMKLKIFELKERSADVYLFDDLIKMLARYQELKEGDFLSLEFFDKKISLILGLGEKYCLFAEREDGKGSIKEKEYEELSEKIDNITRLCGEFGFTVKEDFFVKEEKFFDFIKWIENRNLRCYAHLGKGFFHPVFRRTEEDLIKELYTFSQSTGRAGGHSGYGLKKENFVPMELRNKIKRLKNEYDYNNLMNKGKLLRHW